MTYWNAQIFYMWKRRKDIHGCSVLIEFKTKRRWRKWYVFLAKWHLYPNLSSCSIVLLLTDLTDLFTTASRSYWSAFTSLSQMMALEFLMSSAKHLIVESLMQWEMSLIKIKIRNRIGPSTVPWGTPLIMRAARDKCPLDCKLWHCEIFMVFWDN